MSILKQLAGVLVVFLAIPFGLAFLLLILTKQNLGDDDEENQIQ